MRVEVFDDYAGLSQRASDLVAGLIRTNPASVLGLPTGSTPEGFYTALCRSGASFQGVRTFNLDEYVGLPREHAQSYYTFMKQHLYDHVDLPPEQAHIPNGMAPDLEAECRRYEETLRAAGGLDVVVLGIGLNGHIGFNEPGAAWDAPTHPVMLAQATREANARFFGSLEAVPTRALTMGIGTILRAHRILLLASGSAKAEIVKRTVEGALSISVPATALQSHPNVTVLVDRAAAGMLSSVA